MRSTWCLIAQSPPTFACIVSRSQRLPLRRHSTSLWAVAIRIIALDCPCNHFFFHWKKGSGNIPLAFMEIRKKKKKKRKKSKKESVRKREKKGGRRGEPHWFTRTFSAIGKAKRERGGGRREKWPSLMVIFSHKKNYNPSQGLHADLHSLSLSGLELGQEANSPYEWHCLAASPFKILASISELGNHPLPLIN